MPVTRSSINTNQPPTKSKRPKTSALLSRIKIDKVEYKEGQIKNTTIIRKFHAIHCANL